MKTGRIIITCESCGRAQSTHSSNRTKCHTCAKKCTKKTTFNKTVKGGTCVFNGMPAVIAAMLSGNKTNKKPVAAPEAGRRS